MKARIPSKNRLSKEVIEAINEVAEEQLKTAQIRSYKLMCAVLYEEIGWGKKRIDRLLKATLKKAESMIDDEVAWGHIDRTLIDYLKIEGLTKEKDESL